MVNKVSNDQLDLLLEFLTEHPTLAKGVGLGARSKETVDKQWNDLALQLYSFGSGSTKSGDRWKKYWVDLKYKTKTRVSKRRQEATKTGGGPSSQDDLSEVDKKVLAIIGEEAVFGDSQHKVPIFNTESDCTQSRATATILSQETPIPCCSTQINSPSTRGNTSATYFIEKKTNDDNPEPTQTEVLSPVSRADRPGLRRNRRRSSIAPIQSRINTEWVIGLERRRVDAESRLADAATVMAEASRMQAAAANTQAEALNTLVQLVQDQLQETRALMQTLKGQREKL